MYVHRPQCNPTRDTEQVVNGKITKYVVSTWNVFKYFILQKENYKGNIKNIKPNQIENINYYIIYSTM